LHERKRRKKRRRMQRKTKRRGRGKKRKTGLAHGTRVEYPSTPVRRCPKTRMTRVVQPYDPLASVV